MIWCPRLPVRRVVVPGFAMVGSEHRALEELADGCSTHHLDEVNGFDGIFDAKLALEVARRSYFVAVDDVEVGNEACI